MKQTPTTKSLSDEEDLTQSWLIGPTRSCSYWNSSVKRESVLFIGTQFSTSDLKDEITENGGNLEQGPNMTSSSEV